MKDLRYLLTDEFSGKNAKEHTANITEFYRSPGSSGIHYALEYVRSQLEKYGLDEMTIETYPVDGVTEILGHTVYPAWEPKDVALRVVDPVDEELVNYQETPTCIEWFSTSTPPGRRPYRSILKSSILR